MPTLADFDRARKQTSAPAQRPTEAPSGRYAPGLEDDYTSAFLGEAGRTAKEAAIGLARSPLDALRGLLGLPKQIAEGLVGPQGLPALIHDPSLLKEAPAAAAEGVKYLGENPREAGSLLGQTLLGKYSPEIGSAATTVAGKVPSGMITAGEAMARGGQNLQGGGIRIGGIHVPISTLGLAEAALRGDPKGLAVAAAPYALEYGGKGVAAAGRALEGLKAETKAEAPRWDPAGPSKRAAAQAAQQTAREKASGNPLADESNAVDVTDTGYTDEPVYGQFKPRNTAEEGPAGYSPDDLGVMRDLRRTGYQPGAIRNIIGANEADLAKFTREGQKAETRGTPAKAPATAPAETPATANPLQSLRDLVKKFQEEEVLGKDRTTGHFEEGSGGLSDLYKGNIQPNEDIPRNPAFLDFANDSPAPPLTPKQRMDARAQERFGRRYRREF